jgi:uncharacterized protein
MEHKLTFGEYNEALKQDKLIGLKCESCGAVIVPPRLACRQCGSSDLKVIGLNGGGHIQTFTVINVAPEGKESEVPYIVVMVELNEGAWLMGNLSGVKPEDATIDIIGKKVRMEKTITHKDRYSAGDVARPIFALEAS